jgi:hypothetical protein
MYFLVTTPWEYQVYCWMLEDVEACRHLLPGENIVKCKLCNVIHTVHVIENTAMNTIYYCDYAEELFRG